MEKELIQELVKLKAMYEKKIEEAQSIPHYEDQESYDWMAFAYEEIVLDLVHLIERVVREPLVRNDLINEKIVSQQDFTKAMDEIMAHIGIDMSTKSDFTSSDIVPNAFVGFLGKTEDGKVEIAKKEIAKVFDINKTMKEGTK